MIQELDDFLCQSQCEEVYSEQILEELNEFYKALNEQEYEQEPNQSGQQSLC